MYGSSITNNPFVSDPTNAQARFPDLSGSPDPQYASWLQNQGRQISQPSGILGQQLPGPQSLQPTSQFQQQFYQPSYQHQQASYQQQLPQYTGFPQQSSQAPYISPQQTSYLFAQQQPQPRPQVYGSSYGYLNPQASVQQNTGNPGYLAQFDPYSSIGQGWEGQTQGQAQSPTGTSFSSSTSVTTSSSASSATGPHPREYIRTHKSELESWDTYSWKQMFNAFDALRDSWSKHKRELGDRVTQVQTQMQQAQAQYGYGYGGGYIDPAQYQQEGARLQGLQKEADSHIDSITASVFQMREVFSGYRQSSDPASKRRVRESCNAALQSLPDWPPQVY